MCRNTRTNDGELRLTIMSSFAQDESRRTSERSKWGQMRSMEKLPIVGSGIQAVIEKQHADAASPQLAGDLQCVHRVAGETADLLGHDKVDVIGGKMTVNPEGAEVVRLIFHKYLQERKGCSTIAWIRSPQYFSFFRILVTVADDQRQLPLLLRIPASRSSRAMVLKRSTTTARNRW